ncbi:peptide deformylase [bacterium]|nr:peptide deformylase [bacterium]
MKSLFIRIYGDSVLRKKASPVSKVTSETKELVSQMTDIMHDNNGAGLAAPQVGISKRIIVADIGESPLAIINPEIISKEGEAVGEEGCLSIPGITVDVKRAQRILVVGLNTDGETVEVKVSNLMARVLQHEVDHLNGTLIIDYADIQKRQMIKGKLKKLKKNSAKLMRNLC